MINVEKKKWYLDKRLLYSIPELSIDAFEIEFFHDLYRIDESLKNYTLHTDCHLCLYFSRPNIQ